MIKNSVVAEINLKQLAKNIACIKQHLNKKVKLMAVVKGNGYGYGVVKIAKQAVKSGANYLGVARLSEGIELRNNNIKSPILILTPIIKEEAKEVLNYNLSATVASVEAVKALDQAAKILNKKAVIHIKIDTGLNRFGIKPSNAASFLKEIYKHSNIIVEGMFSHFASAYSDAVYTKKQLNIFTKLLKELKHKNLKPPIIHIANSPATIKFSETHFDMVRCGSIIYGQPLGANISMPSEIKHILSWKAKIQSIGYLEPGKSIGYGLMSSIKYTTKKQKKYAVLNIGFCDGFPKSPSSWKNVLIKGQFASIIGEICMNNSLIDITNIKEEVKIGDEVVLIGKQGSAEICLEDVKKETQINLSEIILRISLNVPKIYFS
jgi:alanine racemase